LISLTGLNHELNWSGSREDTPSSPKRWRRRTILGGEDQLYAVYTVRSVFNSHAWNRNKFISTRSTTKV